MSPWWPNRSVDFTEVREGSQISKWFYCQVLISKLERCSSYLKFSQKFFKFWSAESVTLKNQCKEWKIQQPPLAHWFWVPTLSKPTVVQLMATVRKKVPGHLLEKQTVVHNKIGCWQNSPTDSSGNSPDFKYGGICHERQPVLRQTCLKRLSPSPWDLPWWDNHVSQD